MGIFVILYCIYILYCYVTWCVLHLFAAVTQFPRGLTGYCSLSFWKQCPSHPKSHHHPRQGNGMLADKCHSSAHLSTKPDWISQSVEETREICTKIVGFLFLKPYFSILPSKKKPMCFPHPSNGRLHAQLLRKVKDIHFTGEARRRVLQSWPFSNPNTWLVGWLVGWFPSTARSPGETIFLWDLLAHRDSRSFVDSRGSQRVHSTHVNTQHPCNSFSLSESVACHAEANATSTSSPCKSDSAWVDPRFSWNMTLTLHLWPNWHFYTWNSSRLHLDELDHQVFK